MDRGLKENAEPIFWIFRALFSFLTSFLHAYMMYDCVLLHIPSNEYSPASKGAISSCLEGRQHFIETRSWPAQDRSSSRVTTYYARVSRWVTSTIHRLHANPLLFGRVCSCRG